MVHESLFVVPSRVQRARRDDQFGSINWVMGAAGRKVGARPVAVARHVQRSNQAPFPGCGYPDLLATGEVCDAEQIHDRQHPHDLFMELGGALRRSAHPAAALGAGRRGCRRARAGPRRFPASHLVVGQSVGPDLPSLARLVAHHLWRDHRRTVYGTRWKAEASVFNGREPDAERNQISISPGSTRCPPVSGFCQPRTGRFRRPSGNWSKPKRPMTVRDGLTSHGPRRR